MIKRLTFHSFKKIFPFLILAILIGLCINLVCFKVEYNQMRDNLNQVDKSIAQMKWDYIESVLQEDYLGAGVQSKAIAMDVDVKLIGQYPDMNQLKDQLDHPDGEIEPAYVQVFKDALSKQYLFKVKNDNNDPFIASRSGILMDLSANCLPDEIPRTWNKEVPAHYNPELARVAINKILSKCTGMIFWEYLPSSNPDHMMITSGDVRDLEQVYAQEGFEGLKTYEFLAPAYITDAGDIFGVSDVTRYSTRETNHKLIVVQGFNIYDQIMARHALEINDFDVQKELIHRDMRQTMVIRTFTVIASSVIILLVVYMLMIFNNRTFHEKGFCPYEDRISSDKEGDQPQD